mgnify:CR=1 FL=1
MEIEYFVPADAEKAMEIYNQWKADCMHYWTEMIGISPEHLRFKDHEKLAHYAAAAVDIEYLYPRGFGEIQGIHNRTNFDLTQHQEHSSKDMQYTDPFTGDRYIPLFPSFNLITSLYLRPSVSYLYKASLCFS